MFHGQVRNGVVVVLVLKQCMGLNRHVVGGRDTLRTNGQTDGRTRSERGMKGKVYVYLK